MRAAAETTLQHQPQVPAASLENYNSAAALQRPTADSGGGGKETENQITTNREQVLRWPACCMELRLLSLFEGILEASDGSGLIH